SGVAEPACRCARVGQSDSRQRPDDAKVPAEARAAVVPQGGRADQEARQAARSSCMTFSVDVVLKGRDYAVTQNASVTHGDPTTWTDDAVRDVLVEILRAFDRVERPERSAPRPIVLRGFSWIVEPAASGGGVVIAI